MRGIDYVIQLIANTRPAVKVRQLEVSHPGADDDGVWFFERPDGEFDAQVESPEGMCPFLVETSQSDARLTTTSIEKTVEAPTRLLHLERIG
jgi:hypothetical protein